MREREREKTKTRRRRKGERRHKKNKKRKEMQGARQSDVFFGERESGQDARASNATAVQAVANIVKSSLGPVGLDKVRRAFYFFIFFLKSRVLCCAFWKEKVNGDRFFFFFFFFFFALFFCFKRGSILCGARLLTNVLSFSCALFSSVFFCY